MCQQRLVSASSLLDLLSTIPSSSLHVDRWNVRNSAENHRGREGNWKGGTREGDEP